MAAASPNLVAAEVTRHNSISGFQFEPPYVGFYHFAVAVNEPNFNRAFYLPRLPREYYQGDAAVHWTIPISHRRRGWLDERFHAAFRELMLDTAARERLFCPT
jgi:hypothetical protein